MNRFAAKYRDRGLLVLAMQVRRDPDVLAENVIHWLERLQPTFPVFRLGWDPEWPARALPWAFLFDHRGKQAFAGRLDRLEPAIVKALDAAPHPVIGGPYEKRKDLARKIAADPDGLGGHLAGLRALPDPDPEVRAMIAAAERWFERRVARIGSIMPGVVERAEAWDTLARLYAGDRLGERAAKARDALRSADTFPAEEAAEKALRLARATFRRCPTRGGYFPYHFTKMNYTVIDDPGWVETRVRMHLEFRLALERIAEAHPDTHAADEAYDLLFAHDVPELSLDAARTRVETAARLLQPKRKSRPAELYEAWLLLGEVREGYLGTDEVSARADEMFSALSEKHPEELLAAEKGVRALRREAERLQGEVQRGGSLLKRAAANDLMAGLDEIAKKAGDTLLGRQIASFVAELRKSFDGTPRVGVRFDPRHAGPGVRIGYVFPGTGAAKAGLAPGDVFLALGGVKIGDRNDFLRALADRKPGETVDVEVRWTSGKVETIRITLGRQLPAR
jgi:hypothetical protein